MIQDRSKGVVVTAVTMLALLCVAPGLSGCGGGESSSGSGGDTTTTTSCGPGEITGDAGTCQPAGLPPDMPCPPGELPLDDGSCQKAGVPASACGAGFMPDGKDGCEPILPADPCPPGQMAVPGDTECHELSPCGSGTWGDIPVEANTQFVDESYAGGSSDGSMEKPWTTIKDGIDAAAKGAVVAVAAGSYAENARIAGKAVRLWGRCPAMVEVVGILPNIAALEILKNASGAEVHGVALTGPSAGIVVSGSTGIEISGVWIHDAGQSGLAVQDTLGVTSAVVEGSLIEQSHGAGVLVVGAEATFEATTVRSTLSDAQGNGIGIQIEEDPGTEAQANVNVRGCLVERNYQIGVNVAAAKATIEATVVRSTLLDAHGQNGDGIDVQEDPETGLRGDLTVRACLVEQNGSLGVLVQGSDATIEATVVRSTLSDATGRHGRGINVDEDPDTKDRANVTIRACLVEENREIGVIIFGSDALVEATMVRSTLPNGNGKGGHGIEVADGYAKDRANVTIRASVVEQNRELGVFVDGSDATIETTAVRSTLPDDAGIGGRGINIQYEKDTNERANVTVRACLVEQNHETGVYVGASDATIETSVVRDTTAMGDDTLGDGISVDNSTATIRGVAVTHNTRAGVVAFGGHVVVTGAVITCNGFDLDGEPGPDGATFSFDGSTGWQCSRKAPAACTELGDCSVLTSNLQAPQELPGAGN